MKQEFAFLPLLSSFIGSITGLLYCSTQNRFTRKKLYLIFICLNFSKKKCEIDVIALAKSLQKMLEVTIMNLALMGFSILNLAFRFIIFSLIIPITDKLFILLFFAINS